jgi:hypothetical protein
MRNVEEHNGMAYVVISCIAESPQNDPRPLKHYFGDISVSLEGDIGTRATLATKMRKRLASPNNTRNVVEQRGIS